MPSFATKRIVPFTAGQMYAVVADVEQYPQFLPMCESLSVRSREAAGDGGAVLTATMAVGYKAIRESFTTRVTLHPGEPAILVEYLDGPFRRLQNRWRFIERATAPGQLTGAHVPVASGSPIPVASGAHIPVASGAQFPVASGAHVPVASGVHVPVASGSPIPVASGAHVPVASGAHVPVASGAHVPVASGSHIPVASGAPIPVASGSIIDFYIDYEFRSMVLGALMGAMFDKAFRRFAEAFEARARLVYGRGAGSSGA